MGQKSSKQREILYLAHVTSIKNIVKILKSGYIYTGLDAALKRINLSGGYTEKDFDATDVEFEEYDFEGQYPGVYMSLITSDMVGDKIIEPVTLYFCSSLLNRKDWHFNKQDAEGYFSSKNTILNLQNLKDFLKKEELDKTNEIIFHHSVPINFISKINCKNIETADLLYNLIPDEFKQTFQPLIQVSNTVSFQKFECPGELRELTPNYCFVFDKNFHYKTDPTKPVNSGYYETMEYYRWMAMQCGLTRRVVDSYDDPEKLNERLRLFVYRKFRLIAEESSA